MNDNLKYYIGYAIVYGLILLVGEGSYRYIRVKPELSRNFSHLASGLISLPYPWVFSSHWWVLLLAVQSSLVLYLTRRLNMFPSHHLEGTKSAGSFLFFASIYLCYVASSHLNNPFFFVLSILVLSVSDVMASMIGRNFGNKSHDWCNRIIKGPKTRAGFLAFFFSSLIIVNLGYFYYMQATLMHAFAMALIISFATACAEGLSTKGFDNLFIPIIALIIMILEASIS